MLRVIPTRTVRQEDSMRPLTLLVHPVRHVAIPAILLGILLGGCGAGTHHPRPKGPFFVGGSVVGLQANNSITLSDGSQQLTLSRDGQFVFAAPHDDRTGYRISITAYPGTQPCAMTYGMGLVNAANVTSVRVICGTVSNLPPAWSVTTGSAITARYRHTSTLLLLPGAAYGTVLAAGGTTGTGALNSAMVYSPATDSWTATGNLGTARYSHTATWLPAINKVLVVGGNDGIRPLNSAELYDPASGQWAATGSLLIARYGHTATLLNDGTVLVAGGLSALGAVPLAEVYDPASGRWTASPLNHLQTARYNHTATLLPDGTVLVAGGISNSGITQAGTELYDPIFQTWSYGADMPAPCAGHTSTLLPDGMLLVAGGNNGTAALNSAALYNWAARAWTPTGNTLAAGRFEHTATLLPSGRVLVAGGSSGALLLSTTELYDPGANAWAGTAPLNAARQWHAETLLASGKILVSGGWDGAGALASSELYW
jgi:hypothetical protein